MDIKVTGKDHLEGYYLARFLPQPLISDIKRSSPIQTRRIRVIKRLPTDKHYPIIDQYDKKAPELGNATLREQIRSLLRQDDWSMAGVFSIGLADEQGEETDDGNVTILINVRPESMTSARATDLVRDIGSLITRVNVLHQTAIEVREAEPIRFMSSVPLAKTPAIRKDRSTYFESTYTARPPVGTSIGPSGVPVSGTLGFYLRLNFDHDEAKYLAVTCHHVVTSGIEAIRPTADASGKDEPEITIASPSMADHGEFVNILKDRIREFEEDQRIQAWQHTLDMESLPEFPSGLKPLHPEVKQILALQQERYAKNRDQLKVVENFPTQLGRVYCSSGIAKTLDGSCNGCVLDWTCIELTKERLDAGSWHKANIIPSSSQTEVQNMVKLDLNRLWLSGVRAPDPMKDGGDCFKVGRTTGLSFGSFNGIKPDCRTSHKVDSKTSVDFVSTETVVISPPQVGFPGFSDSGDSGSLVYDGEGNAVGMLWGGDRDDDRAGKDSVHFVTPLLDILSDIKDTLKNSLGHEDWELEFL